MSATIYTFQRIEKKFLLNAQQYQMLREQFSPYLKMDDYGEHTICNIYFDTPDDLLVRRSLEKPVYKEKLRLRSYGIPDEQATLFLEIKKKYQSEVFKRRISLTRQQSDRFLLTGELPQGDGQILQEIRYFTQLYPLTPKVFLAYDRIALAGTEDPSLRVTFDRRIRCRREQLNPALGDEGKLLLPEESYLMEIKVPGAYPLWMARILSREKLYPTSFSKYGVYYQQTLRERKPIPHNVIHFVRPVPSWETEISPEPLRRLL